MAKDLAELRALVVRQGGAIPKPQNPSLRKCVNTYLVDYQRIKPKEGSSMYNPYLKVGTTEELIEAVEKKAAWNSLEAIQGLHMELFNRKPGIAIIEDYILGLKEDGHTGRE